MKPSPSQTTPPKPAPSGPLAEVAPGSSRLLLFQLPGDLRPARKEECIFDCAIPGLPPQEAVEAASRLLPAFLIRVQPTPAMQRQAVLIEDMALVLALFSRRVGPLYVRSRPPDYQLEHFLKQEPFVVEDWRWAR